MDAFVFILVILWSFFGPGASKVRAESEIISNLADWNNGVYEDTEAESKSGVLKLTPDGEWVARNLRTPNYPLGWGGSSTSDGTYIYLVPGNAESRFLRYQPSDDRWVELASVPAGVYQGGEIMYMDGFVYCFPGGYQKAFYRYTVATDSWTRLTDSPSFVYYGGSLTNDGTDIYATPGNSTEQLFYDVSEDSWSVMTPWPSSTRDGDLTYYDGYLYNLSTHSPNRMYKYEIGGTASYTSTIPGRVLYGSDMTVADGYIYVSRGYSNNSSFYRYNLTDDSWETLPDTPITTSYGNSVVYNGADPGYIFIFRGAGQYNFWKYEIGTSSFVGITDIPVTPGRGSDMVKVEDKLYITRGSNTTTTYEFDPSTNAWTGQENALASIGRYVRGVGASGYAWFFRGNNTTVFYRFTPGGAWVERAEAPATAYDGAVIAYPGSGDYLYALRGNNSSLFWRYSMSGNAWDDEAVADLPAGVYVNRGAAMTSDGVDLYLISGFGSGRFLKYDISEDSWSDMPRAPFASYEGVDLAYDDGKIYATAGNWDSDFWQFTIDVGGSGSWSRLKDVPEVYGYNRAVEEGSSLEFDGDGNLYTMRGANSWMLKYVPGSNTYTATGTWLSETIDLTYVSEWTSLSIGMTLNGGTVTSQTRTSSDLISWSDWENTDGENIESPAGRYIEVRLSLSGGGTVTPEVSQIRINYESDNQAPSSPDELVASSRPVAGEVLSSGSTYAYVHPYFSWTGASDGETEVDGYYVYFGPAVAGSPEGEGSYQTGTNYLVTESMSEGTYYFRMQSKDDGGNVSGVGETFVYVYQGVPGESQVVASDTTDFDGEVAGVAVTGDEIKLESEDDGRWLQKRGALAPGSLYYGAKGKAYSESENKMYVFRGNNSNSFYQYDVGLDLWSTLPSAPSTVYMGGGVIEGPEGYLYGAKGHRTSSFWVYDIGASSWSDDNAADAPNTLYYGSSMVFDGTYIYVTRGDNDNDFYRYEPGIDMWESMESVDFGDPNQAITNNIYAGGDLAYDGADTIYAIQGSNRDGFSSYSISDNAWTVLPDVPRLPYLGGAIVYSQANQKLYYTSGNSRSDFFAYDPVAQEWTRMDDAPGMIYYGADMRIAGDYIYLHRGGANQYQYLYRLSTESWYTPKTDVFGTRFWQTTYDPVGPGGAMVKGAGNYLYMIRGNFSGDFVRYDVESGTSVKLANLPTGAYFGSSLAYDSDNNKIYYSGSYYWRKMWVYDVAADVWSEVGDLPNVFYYRSDMVYDDGYVYATRASGQSSFYRLNVGTTEWETMPNLPSTVQRGSALLYKDNYIYALRGYNSANNPFYRFDIGTTTWSDVAVANLPIDVYYGGFLVDGGNDKLYVARGENDNEFLEYNIAGDSWRELADKAPTSFSYGADGALGSDGVVYVLTGSGSNTYQDGLFSFIPPSENMSFGESGVYTSPSHDLTAVYEFANLKLGYSGADDTSLAVYSRTSDDEETWDSWQTVSQEKQVGTSFEYRINSLAKRYIQLKFEMASTEGIYTGRIYDYEINYYQDTREPTNHTSLNAYTDLGLGTTMVSGVWQNSTAPVFAWSGADDGTDGSGVAGYLVYFGLGETADPTSVGSSQTTTTYSPSSLSSGETYYLRIKAYDDAGNVASDVGSTYVFSFDNVNPGNPQTVTVDPPGYSSVNSFDFAWTGAEDAQSGIAGYCYKTGQVGSTETCIADVGVTGISSYRTGTNTFYIRTKDEAGNSPAEYSTASYYYNSTAPSPPQNLRVVGATSNTVNEFAFAWDPPEAYYGSQTGLRYYYSINNEPTANNVNETGLSVSYLTADAYATQVGDNYLYVVAKDEAGNIDYSLYARVTFTADTTAPGIPRDLEIADVSVKATESWRLAVSWDAPEATGSGISVYRVYRSDEEGASCSGDMDNFESMASTSVNSYVDTGLVQQDYYYCVKACDSTNNCSAVSDTVTMYPDGRWLVAPTLTAEPTASVLTKTATVAWSTDRVCNSFVKYGTGSGDYGEEVGSSTLVAAHVVELSGLTPGTSYYYQVLWTDEDGNTGESEEYTLVTDPAPYVSTVNTDNVGLYEAYIEFTISNASKAMVQYGLTQSYGGVVEVSTSAGSEGNTYVAHLETLEEGTEYHFRIVAEDAEGNEYAGDDYTFETLPVPKILTAKIQQVVGMPTATIRVLWTTNTPVSSIVTYYPTDNPTSARDQIDLALKTEHSLMIQGMLDETDYQVIIKGKDVAGNETDFEPQSLKTATDVRPPKILNFNVETTISGAGEEARAQIIVSWDTDEPATTQVQYGESTGSDYAFKTQEDGALVANHVVTIPDVKPAQIYHLRAVSKDKADNVGMSFDSVVITPKATKSAFNLVIDSLSKTFGFVGGLSL